MTDGKMTGVSPPPVTLTVLGTSEGLVNGTKITTPRDQPNIVIKVVPQLYAILSRNAYLFVTTILGLLAASMSPAGGKLLYTSDFYHLLLTCVNLSLPITALGLLKDTAFILGKLEQRFPLLSGGA